MEDNEYINCKIVEEDSKVNDINSYSDQMSDKPTFEIDSSNYDFITNDDNESNRNSILLGIENITNKSSITHTQGYSIRDIFQNALVVTNPFTSSIKDDVPTVLYFAREKKFWVLMFWSGVIGILMGFFLVLYNLIVNRIFALWVTCDFDYKMYCGDLYQGELYWIGSIALCGIIVGFIRWYTGYPDQQHNIFYEIEHAQGDTNWFVIGLLLQLISMSGGSNLGPEAGMAAFGAGLSQRIVNRIGLDWIIEDQQILVLCGIACAMNGLFVSPVIATLFVFEINQPPKKFIESLLILGFSSFITFLIGISFNKKLNIGIDYQSDYEYIQSIFTIWHTSIYFINVIVAISIGIIGASITCIVFAFMLIFRKIFEYIRNKLKSNSLLRHVIPPLIGGAIIGLVNYILPLTIGDGDNLVIYYTKFGSTDFNIYILIISLFCRCILLSISNTCGFKGGLFYPLGSIGFLSGIIAYRILHCHFKTLKLGLFVGCFIAAVPAAMSPTILSWALYPTLIFYYGLDQSVYFFISAATSYLLLSGTGLQQFLSDPSSLGRNLIRH